MRFELPVENVRGISNELHWNEFVKSVGGELIAEQIITPGIENADYLFRQREVIAELKILETEHLNSPGIRAKIDDIMRENDGTYGDCETDRRIGSVLKAPLKKLVKKANNQIKGARGGLGLNSNHRGLVVFVNSGWTELSPIAARNQIANIIGGLRYSGVAGAMYVSNFPLKEAGVPGRAWPTFTLTNWRADPAFCQFVGDLEQAFAQFTIAKTGKTNESAPVHVQGSHRTLETFYR